MKQRKLKVLASSLLAVGALSLSSTAMAQQRPSFDFIGVNYINLDYEGDSASGYGIEFEGSMTNQWFFAVDYVHGSDDITIAGSAIDLDASNLYGNIGYKFITNDVVSVYGAAGVAYYDVEATGPGGSAGDDDTGWNLQLGVRAELAPNFEVDANIRHVDVADGSDQEFSIGGKFYVTPAFSLGANYVFADSDNGYWALGGQFHF